MSSCCGGRPPPERAPWNHQCSRPSAGPCGDTDSSEDDSEEVERQVKELGTSASAIGRLLEAWKVARDLVADAFEAVAGYDQELRYPFDV